MQSDLILQSLPVYSMDGDTQLRVISICLVGLFSLATGQIPKEFNVQADSTSFEVYIGSIKFLQHTNSSPVVYIGNGYTDIKTASGNFDIESYIDSRIPLSQFVLEEDAYTANITLFIVQGIEVTLTLSTTTSHQLVISFSQYPAAGYDRTWLRIHSESTEHIYGAGEQFTFFDLRGRSYPIWTREQGVGRNWTSPLTYFGNVFGDGAGGDYHTTYFPQASFVSSRKYYCHVTGYSYKILDFEPQSFHEIMQLGTPNDVLFTSGNSLLEVVESQSEYFGRQPILPNWLATGTVIGMQGGTDRMLDILNTSQTNGVSVSGMWIQDWSGSIYTGFGKRVFWNWEWNPEQYPDLDTEIIRLRDEEGVRLLAYITGHLNINGSVYQKATGNDYFMKDSEGEEYIIDFGSFYCATVDLTNPEAWQWYKDLIKTNLIDFGFGGWMADFGEYIPADAVFYNGETGLTMHNRFPVLWAQLNREAIEESGKLGEIMFFMRAGGPGTQQYSVNSWAGDQNVDWTYEDGLASTIPAALSLGMSGFGLTHFDIGGYTTIQEDIELENFSANVTVIRSDELFFRGAELAVFTPMMRTHEGNLPDLNFQVYRKDEDLQRFSVFVNMFKALSNYTRDAMETNTATGVPVQRPLYLHYENDQETYSIGHQYLLGRDLLVAPVLSKGRNVWRVYLPVDDWVYLYDETPYTGGQEYTVPAPVGKPPVFYRAQSAWVDTFREVAAIANQGIARQTCQDYDVCP